MPIVCRYRMVVVDCFQLNWLLHKTRPKNSENQNVIRLGADIRPISSSTVSETSAQLCAHLYAHFRMLSLHGGREAAAGRRLQDTENAAIWVVQI